MAPVAAVVPLPVVNTTFIFFLGSPCTTLKIDMKGTGIVDGRFTITQRAITDT